MSESEKKRFNLVFSGQLLTATDPDRAKRTLAAFFGLQDIAGVEVFFSGKAVPIRRHLTRADARDLYQQLRDVGLICDIVPEETKPPAAKQPESTLAPTPAPAPAPAMTSPPAAPAKLARPRGKARTKLDTAIRAAQKQVGQAQAQATSPAAPPPAASPGTPRAVVRPAASATTGAAIEAPSQSRGTRAQTPPARSVSATTPPLSARPATAGSPAPSKPAIPARRGLAPNLFALRPAFITGSAPARLEQLQIRGFIAAGAALALSVVIMAVLLRFPAAPAGSEPRGPLALATLPGNELLMLLDGALLIHERSGLAGERIAASTLGFKRFAPPLWADSAGNVFLNAVIDGDPPRLQRCDLSVPACQPVADPGNADGVLAIDSSLSGATLFFLNATGNLLRADASGVVQASASVKLPWGRPRLLASDGLLLIPASDGPLLGVYRPDPQGFGQQLDALLLMPAEAVAAGRDRIRDIALGEEYRWALLAGEDVTAGLFRFDPQWGNGVRIEIAADMPEPYLHRWRDKLLLADVRQMQLQRFAADGRPEVPFDSTMLRDERLEWQRLSRQRALTRSLGVALPLLLLLACAGAALLYAAAYTALSELPAQRTALLDPMPGGIRWLPASRRRGAAIDRLAGLLLAPVVCAALALVLARGWLPGLTLLPLIFACLYVWRALYRGSGGYVGVVDGRVIAVDYDHRYFYGESSLLRGVPGLLLAPGVALPLHGFGLRNFEPDGCNDIPGPARESSAAALVGALWLQGHPWLHALIALAAGGLCSITLLLIVTA